jgi:hypothetical protein
MSATYALGTAAALATAIEVARSLNDAGIPDRGTNPEYERGQAELICDLFGLPMSQHLDEITKRITS